jgi:hypothetical protein
VSTVPDTMPTVWRRTDSESLNRSLEDTLSLAELKAVSDTARRQDGVTEPEPTFTRYTSTRAR